VAYPNYARVRATTYRLLRTKANAALRKVSVEPTARRQRDATAS
jgi:hypothetical protein